MKTQINVNERIIYKSNTPKDIIICGTSFNDKEVFTITDDYYPFSITKNGDGISVESNGFVSIVDLKTFIENQDDAYAFDEDDFWFSGIDIVLIHNFVGEAKLRVNVEDIGYIDTTNIESSDLIMCDTLASDHDFDVEIDIKQGEVFKLDEKSYKLLKNHIMNLKQFYDIVKKYKNIEKIK